MATANATVRAETGGLPDVSKTTLLWLPQPKIRKYKGGMPHDPQFLFNLTDLVKNNPMWNLIETSLPPLLARKYHVMNVSDLMSDIEHRHYVDVADRRYVGVATWFVLWSQAFGLQYLNYLQCRQEALAPLLKGINAPLTKQWMEHSIGLLLMMGKASTVPTAPKLEDNSTKASEFLLEPCVIIQLPWSTVLLHQWLAAALVVVLLFEKSSVELRHWPLPREVEPCARELLTLVKQLKERIVLGFAILSQQVTFYPRVEAKHPGWIMDEVVLPSLATLQFLISGKAANMLKSIKKLAWLEHVSTSGYLYISDRVYSMDVSLAEVFTSLFYSYNFCSILKNNVQNNSIQPYFASENCNLVNIQNAIKRINNSTTETQLDAPECGVHSDGPSSEEFIIAKLIQSSQVACDSPLEFAVEIVKELMLDTGRILPSIFMEFVFLFNSQNTSEIPLKDLTDTAELVFFYSSMYKSINDILIVFEKETSVLARIVSLGLEVLEREQLIRLSYLVCNTVNTSPLAIKQDKSAPMSVVDMSKLLQEVREKRGSQNQDWLWNQFAAEWRRPVNPREPPLALQIRLGTTAIVKTCQDRIGRIVLNAARSCFSVYERGGDVFPYWQTVQYILPCFVASFVDTMNAPNSKSYQQFNMLKYIDGALKFYENKFNNWNSSNVIPRQVMSIAPIVKEKSAVKLLSEYARLIEYYQTHLYMLQSIYVEAKPLLEREIIGIYGTNELQTSLTSWTDFVVQSSYVTLVYSNCKTWLEKSLEIITDIYEISVQSWQPIQPGSPAELSIVDRIYLADCVAQAIDLAFTISHAEHCADKLQLSCPDQIVSYYKQRNQLSACDIEWRFEIFRHVNTKSIGCVPTLLQQKYIVDGKKAVCELYDVLKLLGTFFNSGKLLLALKSIPNSPPEVKIAVQCYLDGDFSVLDKIFDGLRDGKGCKPRETNAPKPSLTVPETKRKVSPSVYEKCRNCPKTQRKWRLEPCEQCVTDKYTDVNYFCSKACKEARWKEEHMAEHLEFDLGLADFSHLNIK